MSKDNLKPEVIIYDTLLDNIFRFEYCVKYVKIQTREKTNDAVNLQEKAQEIHHKYN